MGFWRGVRDRINNLPWTDQNYLDEQRATAAANALAKWIRDGTLPPGYDTPLSDEQIAQYEQAMRDAEFDAEARSAYADEVAARMTDDEARAIAARDRATTDHLSNCDDPSCATCAGLENMTSAEQDAQATESVAAERRLHDHVARQRTDSPDNGREGRDAPDPWQHRPPPGAEDRPADSHNPNGSLWRWTREDYGREGRPDTDGDAARSTTPLTEDERAWDDELAADRAQADADAQAGAEEALRETCERAVADAREAAEQAAEAGRAADNAAADSSSDTADGSSSDDGMGR